MKAIEDISGNKNYISMALVLRLPFYLEETFKAFSSLIYSEDVFIYLKGEVTCLFQIP